MAHPASPDSRRVQSHQSLFREGRHQFTWNLSLPHARTGKYVINLERTKDAVWRREVEDYATSSWVLRRHRSLSWRVRFIPSLWKKRRGKVIWIYMPETSLVSSKFQNLWRRERGKIEQILILSSRCVSISNLSCCSFSGYRLITVSSACYPCRDAVGLVMCGLMTSVLSERAHVLWFSALLSRIRTAFLFTPLRMYYY
jgi:hypothetical protein